MSSQMQKKAKTQNPSPDGLFKHFEPNANLLSQMDPRHSEKQKKASTQNPSPQQILDQVRSAIISARESQFLTFNNIDPETGSWVVDSLVKDAEVERIRPR